jgi:hypothetical protein
MAKEKTLPKKIEQYLDTNFAFNKFGIVNLAVVKAHAKCKLSDAELKKLINKRFAKEMIGENIEYIGLEKSK